MKNKIYIPADKIETLVLLASEQLKRVRITVKQGYNKTVIKLTPDGILVTNNNKLAGIIEDGQFISRGNQYVEQLITQLNQDPQAQLAQFGREQELCCFCWRALTDERSVQAGYGPVCAQRFQLPWGSHENTLATI